MGDSKSARFPNTATLTIFGWYGSTAGNHVLRTRHGAGMAIGCGSTRAAVLISPLGEEMTTIDTMMATATPIAIMTATTGTDLTGTGNRPTTPASSAMDIAIARQIRDRALFIARAAAPSSMRILFV